jgi:hypothetical protein
VKALLAASIVLSFATAAERQLDQRFGRAHPERFDSRPSSPAPPGSLTLPAGAPAAAPDAEVSFRRDVLPVLERRCVVCHGCYDAPCQLKLGSFEGVARGASKHKVYDGERLLEIRPTRLFEDAEQPSEWRKLDFFPVLNERNPEPANDRLGSLLYRMLDLKRRHPLAAGGVLPRQIFDVGIDRKQTCPNLAEIGAFEAEHPDWGMPFGLPGIGPAEQALIERWLARGSPREDLAPLPAPIEAQIRTWEAFFAGSTLKDQLVSRYLYEHLFLATIYFEDDPLRTRFRLVRSSTPPGEPIRIIATRRPTDPPGVSRVFYRLARVRETIVEKTDMPYALGPARLTKLREIFFSSPDTVTSLPSYDADVASNPFVAFASLPARARYRFMLDEAELTMMGFIKGPVCRGQVALNVIEDQFWIFFADPEADVRGLQDGFLRKEASDLRLPAGWGSRAPIVVPWLEYKRLQNRYLRAKSQFLEQKIAPIKIDFSAIWAGDGKNQNAALTVFRHFNSATVVKGLIGPEPKTIWVLSYSELERIHYLLVAGFDVFGNIGHQLNTRLYMDFLRMQAEFNFLEFLPLKARKPLRDLWYRGAPDSVKEQVYGRAAHFDRESSITYRTDNPKSEFLQRLAQRLDPIVDKTYDLTAAAVAAAAAPAAGVATDRGPPSLGDPQLLQDLQVLARLRGASLGYLPETAILRIDLSGGSPLYLTLVRNTGHTNVSSIFTEENRILPAEDTLTVAPGFIGAYTNALFVVPRSMLSHFTALLAGLDSEARYAELASQFAIRRTNPRFWEYADALQAAHAASTGGFHGLLDLSRYENR